MDWRQRNLMAEAIYLFEGDAIITELRFDDFRSRLLNGERIEPFKNETVRAAYAAIGSGLTLEAACLFLIQFDSHGIGQADWNLPVRELAHASGSGPDLGAGPISLAGRGQCSIPWHNLRLWMPREPQLEGICRKIQETVTRNALGFRSVRPNKMTDLALEQDVTRMRPRPPAPQPPAPTPIGRAAKGQPPRRPAAPHPGSTTAEIRRLEPREIKAQVEADPPRPLPQTTRELRTSGAVRALKQAELSFEAAFGREGRLTEDQAQRARNLGAAIAQLRAAHAREVAQIRSAHERTVASMKTEIQRLRAENERLAKLLAAAESQP